MSGLIQSAENFIKDQANDFNLINNKNGEILNFEKECLFAKQQLEKNDFTLSVAANNNGSLKNAIINIASIGISLNPAYAHAYLVPRDGAVCLDISYKGLIKLATDTGSILWAKAVLVHEQDKFEWLGPAEAPSHKADVFKDRGAIIGGYCIAETHNNRILCDTMTIAEIEKIRDTSKTWTNEAQRKYSPWLNWPEEMMKKTLIRRAYKSWPQTDKKERLDYAVHALNEYDGIETKSITVSDISTHSPEQKKLMDEMIIAEDVTGLFLLRASCSDNVWTSLHHSFNKGEKGVMRANLEKLCDKGKEIYDKQVIELHNMYNSGDDHGALEIIQEMTRKERKHITDNEDGEFVLYLHKVYEERPKSS